VAALETGNNLRLPREDFMFIIEDVAEEVAEEPGFEGFKAPIDKSRFTQLVAYHDPCNYGRKAQKHFGHGYFDEPRWIMDQCLENWVDLYPNRMHQICCGGGGGTMTTGYNDERLFYAGKKIDQIKATGAKMIVVPCHSQFSSVKSEYDFEGLEVKYLWELVADCLIL